MKKTKFFKLGKAFRDYVQNDKMISLGNSFELPALFRAYGWRLFVSVFAMPPTKSQKRLLQLGNFGKFLLRMTKHHGAAFTVSYLKACQLAVQRKVARNPVKSLREIDPKLPLSRLSKSGLPSIIGTRDRRLLLVSPLVLR